MTKVTAWHHMSTARRIEVLERAAHEGLTVPEVAERHGTTANRVGAVVAYYRREKGIDLPFVKARPGFSANIDRTNAVSALFSAGFTAEQIASAFGIKAKAVHNIAYRARLSDRGAFGSTGVA
ncbi:helix-turn-helix domain-containing protein [Paracoccus sulfuroxidans]|uniref:Uncharacterized protein n=1 Tax=Paracoccus sulfuroxidans TaxID=384678 RepID=A0A562NLY7_9RHOB|nr:helix-turn-helix domain-containing protein [Paracoccus sulfuroxidans]TWI32756.1 hypothetical protein IQ24_02631 [Paracoccus sulfuroxidans]